MPEDKTYESLGLEPALLTSIVALGFEALDVRRIKLAFLWPAPGGKP